MNVKVFCEVGLTARRGWRGGGLTFSQAGVLRNNSIQRTFSKTISK